MSIIFVVVYVGAIAVLFLFIVMMLNIKHAQISESFIRYWILTLFLGVVFFGQLFVYFSATFEGCLDIFEYDWLNTLHQFDNVVLLGLLIYTDFILTFLTAGLIL